MVSRSPRASCPAHTLSIVPSVVDVCFWLVVALKIINPWPCKARVDCFHFFVFNTPNRCNNVSPHDLPWLRLLSNIIVATSPDCQLIVVYCCLMAAT